MVDRLNSKPTQFYQDCEKELIENCLPNAGTGLRADLQSFGCRHSPRNPKADAKSTIGRRCQMPLADG